eukprot:2260738-Alexandrium_andersonii.AAC.1
MSASLVGSEMCIRDSPSQVQASGGRSGCEADGCEHQGFLEGAPARAAPVSYTHLTLPTICSV